MIYGVVSYIGGTSGWSVNMLRTKLFNNYSPNNSGEILVQDIGLEMRDSVVKENYAGIDRRGINISSPNCEKCAFCKLVLSFSSNI